MLPEDGKWDNRVSVVKKKKKEQARKRENKGKKCKPGS